MATKDDFDQVYLYSIRHCAKSLLISSTEDNVKFEKRVESTQALEQSVELPKGVFHRMLDIFYFSEQLESIIAYGQLSFRTHKKTTMTPCESMETDASLREVIQDYMVCGKSYCRLSFQIYKPDRAYRSIYFHFKRFTKIGDHWERKMTTLSLREFCGLMIYNRSYMAKEIRRANESQGEGEDNHPSTSSSAVLEENEGNNRERYSEEKTDNGGRKKRGGG